MAAVAFPSELFSPKGDQRVLLTGVSWKEYLVLRDVLDGPCPRMTYAHESLELMSPSPAHEYWKKNIARLVELYAYIAGVDLRGYGRATFKKELALRGAEPDECYVVGKPLAEYPEIAIEVVHSSPLLDKLDVYAPMGIEEVWVYAAGAFTLHRLDGTAYVRAAKSELLPGLDFDLLARFVPREDTLAALREFEAAVRGA